MHADLAGPQPRDLRGADGAALAGRSISMPAARYDRHQLPALVATLHRAAGDIEVGGD